MITKWRAGYQREITKAQSAISSKAVETFTSFETVKMFSTERREVQNYNKLRHDLQEASVKTKWMLCLFYFGQSTITGFALVIGMILTVHDGMCFFPYSSHISDGPLVLRSAARVRD